jgi:hypothetical protein
MFNVSTSLKLGWNFSFLRVKMNKIWFPFWNSLLSLLRRRIWRKLVRGNVVKILRPKNWYRLELPVTPIWPESESKSESLISAPQNPESESNSDSGRDRSRLRLRLQWASESKSRLRSRLWLFFLIPAKLLQNCAFYLCQLSITLDLTYISVKLNENWALKYRLYDCISQNCRNFYGTANRASSTQHNAAVRTI